MSASGEGTGRPFRFLAIMMAGWIGMRLLVWDSPFPPVSLSKFPALAERSEEREQDVVRAERSTGPIVSQATRLKPASRSLLRFGFVEAPLAGNADLQLAQLVSTLSHEAAPMIRSDVSRSRPAAGPAHAAPLQPSPTIALAEPMRRFGLDAWVLLRDGAAATRPVGGVRPAGYGGSQAGAILRYRFAPDHALRPTAYLRASAALERRGEGEAAIGLSARPVAAWPIDAHIEARIAEGPDGARIRPAAFLVGGFDRTPLSGGIELSGYGQAGYVGGDFATGFVDGRLVAEHEVMEVEDISLRIGAGAWGGAQRDAARLDIGPSAGMETRIGDAAIRLTVDYRIRVAGDAEPGNGPAVTLSTGF